jgi:glycosyltransferase 2 family protein
MNIESSNPSKKRILNSRTLRSAGGYAVAVIALYWVFHDIKFSMLTREFTHVKWELALLGMCIDVGRYMTQSIRWRLLMLPVGRISIGRTFQALYAGIFLNLLLPLRMGEVARVHLASHFSGARFPTIVSSVFAEYLIDGVWLAVGIGAVALAVPLPKDVLIAARLLGIAVLVAVSAFIFFLFYKKEETYCPDANGQERRHPWKPLRFLVSFLDTIRRGIMLIGRSPLFWPAFAVSAFDIGFHIVAFWIIMISYGINLSFITAAGILLFVFVGLIIPNAPSNVGSFQFLCVLGLLAFGIDKTTASGFSVLFFVLVNIPQVVIGWIAFSRSGEKLYEIRHHIASLRMVMKE